MRTHWAAAMACGILLAALSGCGGDEDTGAAPAPAAPPGFFGVVPQSAVGDEDFARMAQGGIGTLRIVVSWGELDPSPAPGDTSFASVDGIVAGAAAHGIRVLPTIYGTPAWVSSELEENGDPSHAPQSKPALEAWAEFIGELVDRYGPDGSLWKENPDLNPVPVHGWQIWNEQNSPTFYLPKPDPAAYAKLLDAAAGAIRDRDPAADVILGGMLGTPLSGKPPAYTAWEFLRRLYAIPGAREDFDSVGVHPYAAHLEKIREQVMLVHEEVERADDDATLWITEVGASSGTGPNPLDRGPEGQAKALDEAFRFFLSRRQEWRIEGVTWYSWRDLTQPVLCDWCAHSGLFEESGLSPKPAWNAFVSFTRGS